MGTSVGLTCAPAPTITLTVDMSPRGSRTRNGCTALSSSWHRVTFLAFPTPDPSYCFFPLYCFACGRRISSFFLIEPLRQRFLFVFFLTISSFSSSRSFFLAFHGALFTRIGHVHTGRGAFLRSLFSSALPVGATVYLTTV